MKQQSIEELLGLIEQAVGQKIPLPSNIYPLVEVDEPRAFDELAMIKNMIINKNHINKELIHQEVARQLSMFKSLYKSDENETPQIDYTISFEKRWGNYINKLKGLITQVAYRRTHNYEFNALMPSQKELFELQHECLDLTKEYYGIGNISAFYVAFIKMCVAANVSHFDYYKINKYISPDHYLTKLDAKQRDNFSKYYHEHIYEPFVKFGGRWARGRSHIDATSITNIFYYKTARQLLYLNFAKHLIVDALDLENYGQLADTKKHRLWQLICKYYPDDNKNDVESIFYKFTQFINQTPGEYYNYFAAELPEANSIDPAQLYDIIKLAGLQSGKLVMFSRTLTEDWMPKRYLTLELPRKYILFDIVDDVVTKQIRSGGITEYGRVWPNEIPYAPDHGMVMCGDGLMEGLQHYGTLDYEWNRPFDPTAEFDNVARDIEMLFREMQLLNPNVKLKPMLPEEHFLSVFQNGVTYSSIIRTSHLHITRGTIERYPIYCLPAQECFEIQELQTKIEFVQFGNVSDAMFLRIKFSNLDNERLIQFIMQMHLTVLTHFGGNKKIDVYLHLIPSKDGGFVFIYEPHEILVPIENDKYLNPITQSISRKKPQWFIAEGTSINEFTDELAAGINYVREFHDQTCKIGVKRVLLDFMTTYSANHQ